MSYQIGAGPTPPKKPLRPTTTKPRGNWNGEPNGEEAKEVMADTTRPDSVQPSGLSQAEWVFLCALKVLKDVGDVKDREAYIMSALMQQRADRSKWTQQHKDDLKLIKGQMMKDVVARAKNRLGIAIAPPEQMAPPPVDTNQYPTTPYVDNTYYPPMPEPGMSTNTKIAIGVGAVAVVGAGILIATRKK